MIDGRRPPRMRSSASAPCSAVVVSCPCRNKIVDKTSAMSGSSSMMRIHVPAIAGSSCGARWCIRELDGDDHAAITVTPCVYRATVGEHDVPDDEKAQPEAAV